MTGERDELIARLEAATEHGFDGYCTDCESATKLYNGRCGCGSGRVATPRSIALLRSTTESDK